MITFGKARVVDGLRTLEPDGVAASIVSVAELYEGVFRSNNPPDNESKLLSFLNGIDVLTINDGIARIFGQECARLNLAGLPIGDLDLLIAATAIHHSLILVTSDSDFDRVENLETFAFER